MRRGFARDQVFEARPLERPVRQVKPCWRAVRGELKHFRLFPRDFISEHPARRGILTFLAVFFTAP